MSAFDFDDVTYWLISLGELLSFLLSPLFSFVAMFVQLWWA